MLAFIIALALALVGLAVPALCTPVSHFSADRVAAPTRASAFASADASAAALHAALLQQQQHYQQQPLTLLPAHSLFFQRHTPANNANTNANKNPSLLSLPPAIYHAIQQQHAAPPQHATLTTVAKKQYEAYLIKPGDCQSISTWCCGKKTVVKATCGAAEVCSFKLSSVSTYEYTVHNGEFEDLTYSYWHIPVTICNTGEEGVIFVTSY